MYGAVATLSGWAWASPGLTLETGSPDALCPALPTAREAVERRLGTLVVSSGAGWRARYGIAHAPEGTQMDFVRLELFAPDGTLQLSRDLPLESGACSTVAEAIALVLDRYFRKLPLGDGAAAEPAPVAGTPALGTPEGPPSVSPPSVSPAPVSPSVPLHTVSPASPVRDAPPTPEAASGPRAFAPFWRVAAVFATRTAAGPALGLQALRESWPHLYTGAELALDWRADTERLSDGGEVSARTLSGALALGWGERWGVLRGYLGPTLRLSLERGSARGLNQNFGHERARVAAGLGVGLVAGLSRHWSLSATLGLEASLGGGQFVIDRQEVLRPALLEGRLAVGVGYSSNP